MIDALGDLWRLGLEREGEVREISFESDYLWRISALSFGRDGVMGNLWFQRSLPNQGGLQATLHGIRA